MVLGPLVKVKLVNALKCFFSSQTGGFNIQILLLVTSEVESEEIVNVNHEKYKYKANAKATLC